MYYIDDVLTFYCNTHDPLTGGANDADSVPTYRVYEEETGTPLLTGSMAKLDDSNTDGFYSEQITLSAANGFEENKNYCIRKSATVNGVTGVSLECFRVIPASLTAAAVNAEVVDALGTDTIAEMSSGAPPSAPTIKQALMYLYMALRNDTTATRNGTKERRIKNDAGTVITKATTTDDGSVFSQGKLGAP